MGPCRQCGSSNTHDCFHDPDNETLALDECQFINAVDDPIMAHCDDCGCLFCTECDTVLRSIRDKPLSEVVKMARKHSDSCQELEPKRWAQKYGTTRRLISVEGEMITITGPVEFDREDETLALRLSDKAGVTVEQLKGKIGRYMKFDCDDEEILAVAELE